MRRRKSNFRAPGDGERKKRTKRRRMIVRALWALELFATVVLSLLSTDFSVLSRDVKNFINDSIYEQSCTGSARKLVNNQTSGTRCICLVQLIEDTWL